MASVCYYIQLNLILIRCTGDVFRLAPNELSFATTQSHRDIYTWKSSSEFLKTKSFYHTISTMRGMVFSRDPTEHAVKRKRVAPSLTPTVLKNRSEPVIHQYTNALVSKLGELSSKNPGGVNITEAFNWLTFDVLGELQISFT